MKRKEAMVGKPIHERAADLVLSEVPPVPKERVYTTEDIHRLAVAVQLLVGTVQDVYSYLAIGDPDMTSERITSEMRSTLIECMGEKKYRSWMSKGKKKANRARWQGRGL